MATVHAALEAARRTLRAGAIAAGRRSVDRGVSETIGVLLMVGLTVILAAVIGLFVLQQ